MKNARLKKISTFWFAAAAVALGLVGAVGFAPAPASAQGTPEQQQACTPDVMRLCSAFVPDIPKITVCMRHNWKSVSPACRTALHPAHGTPHHASHHRSHRSSHH
jgi:hypothetical protein